MSCHLQVIVTAKKMNPRPTQTQFITEAKLEIDTCEGIQAKLPVALKTIHLQYTTEQGEAETQFFCSCNFFPHFTK